MRRVPRWASLLTCGGLLLATPGQAQNAGQVVPSIPEMGAPTFVAPSAGSGSGASGSSGASYSGPSGGTDAYATMLNQSYGIQAVAAAKAAGINPDALAAFGQIESHFQNVGNASSSASGVWQITDGTWNQYAAQLGLSGADRSDPTVQAQVASAVMSSYAASVDKVTGTPATAVQVYGAYMFGPGTGAQLAQQQNQDRPLSDFVSASTLASNHMTGLTVAQYYSTMAQRMGSGATEAVRTT